MTAPLDESRLRELAEAEARLREEIDGYRVAAEIERGVMWSLAPYVEQWNADRSSGRSGIDMLTRFVRENSSSRSNAERMDRLANDTQLVLDALSAERERGDRAVEKVKARREIYRAKRDAKDPFADDSLTGWEMFNTLVEAFDIVETEILATQKAEGGDND